jgi:heme/copper-type cytochrome/quinol oxidase subunit 2
MTRAKIIFINIIIVVGAVAIAVLQWPRARENIGNADDIGGAILLEVLIAGIPIVIWAGVAHFGLSWLLMRRGELDAYYACDEIERLPRQTRTTEQESHDVIE